MYEIKYTTPQPYSMRCIIKTIAVISFVSLPHYIFSQLADNKKIVRELINATYPIAVPPPENSKTFFSEKVAENNKIYNVESQLVKTSSQFETMVAFDPNKQALWPGCVIQGKDLPDGILTPINFPRNAINIGVTNLLGGSHTIVDTIVERPTFAKVNTVLNKLMGQEWNSQATARMEINAYRVYTAEQALIDLGINARFAGFSTAAQLFSHHNSSDLSYVVKFVQNYYSITCDPPVLPESFFNLNDAVLSSQGLTVGDFKTVIQESNPPAYISTVNYGRMFLFVFTLNNASSEEQRSMTASFNGLIGGSNLSFNSQQKSIIEKCSISAMVLGGSGSEGGKVISLDESVGNKNEKIMGFIQEGANSFRNAVPISYVVNYLKDNSLARVSSATSYKIPTSKYEPVHLTTVTIHTHTHGDDKDGDESIIFQIRNRNNAILASTGNISGGITYDDNTDQPPVELRLNENVRIYQRDCSNTIFYWKKNPNEKSGKGWRVSVRVIGHLSSGAEVELYNMGETLIGDGNPYEFSIPISCNW